MVTGAVCIPGPPSRHPITDRPGSPPLHLLQVLTGALLLRAPKRYVRHVGLTTPQPQPPTLNSAARGLLALSREVVSRRFW